MVGMNMDGPLRDQVLKLMQEKDRLENQIRDENVVLETNHVGMTEPLVDPEGYPRSDIDVYKIRHARHRIACLQNDHKNLMKKIEQGLGEIHSHLLLPSNGHTVTPREQEIFKEYTASTNREAAENKSFAKIGYIHDGSPADLAGLLENDEVIQFGSLNAENFTEVTQLHNIVVNSVGQPIQVKVKRNDSIINVNVTPRPGSQPGLLGCQILRQVGFTRISRVHQH